MGSSCSCGATANDEEVVLGPVPRSTRPRGNSNTKGSVGARSSDQSTAHPRFLGEDLSNNNSISDCRDPGAVAQSPSKRNENAEKEVDLIGVVPHPESPTSTPSVGAAGFHGIDFEQDVPPSGSISAASRSVSPSISQDLPAMESPASNQEPTQPANPLVCELVGLQDDKSFDQQRSDSTSSGIRGGPSAGFEPQPTTSGQCSPRRMGVAGLARSRRARNSIVASPHSAVLSSDGDLMSGGINETEWSMESITSEDARAYRKMSELAGCFRANSSQATSADRRESHFSGIGSGFTSLEGLLIEGENDEPRSASQSFVGAIHGRSPAPASLAAVGQAH